MSDERDEQIAQLQQQVERLTQGQAEANNLIGLYKEQVARLSAPVSDTEYRKYSSMGPGYAITDGDFNDLIAARLAPPATGGKNE